MSNATDRMLRPNEFPYLCNLCLTPVHHAGDNGHGLGECVDICDCIFNGTWGDEKTDCSTCRGTGSPNVVRVKSISLWQPWADLLVRGVKRYETRGWEMKHRGPLAIHAALKPFRPKNYPASFNSFLDNLPAWQELGERSVERFEVSELKYGGLVGVVNVTDSQSTSALKYMNPIDEMLGDYGQGRWYSRCKKIRQFPEMIPCRGTQGFFYTDLASEALSAT